jgi:hypothetical protein
LGIIGTFSGLIKGLSHFHVSPTPEETQLALSNLIQAVGHAFYFSAAAIVLAILFTCIEKLLLSSCYARVERIQHAIDRLFRGGAGEEYLERLVQACETSATQALHIKEALVADLKQILQEVTAQQVAASSRDSSRMVAELGGAIAATLRGPVADISVAVEQQTNATVMNLSREVENLIRLSSETSRSLQCSITTLAEETRDSIGRMKSSAELVYAASSEFGKAGERLTARLDGSGNALEKIEAATHLLGVAMNSATEVLEDYKESRGVFARMIEDLKGTIQNAKKEAFMTSDLIERLGAAASQLGNAEKQSETYLLGINEVLSQAHEVFAQNVEKTLQRGNAQFHKELSEAVGLLSTGIRDLEAVLERVPVEG